MTGLPFDAYGTPLRRRTVLSSIVGAAALGLTGCVADAPARGALGLGDPLPSTVPPDTALTIAIHTSHLQLQAAGLLDDLPFVVRDWPNISAGPDVIQGFRANSIDLASNAGIPPIQARAIGFDAKIVAVQARTKPNYQLATAPGAAIGGLSDLRGKKIGFSQGQAQGVVVLRTLKQLGLGTDDVTLVPLNSPQFLTALQARQVDAAPLGEPTLTKYLRQYGTDGARAVEITALDYLTILWAPTSVLTDPARAAAVAAFIPLWARAKTWAYENPDAWIDHFYVKDQGVTAEDGRRIVAVDDRPVFPTNWDKAIGWEQETIDLMAQGGFVPTASAAELFDRRFEPIAARSVAAAYRE
ncbi:ABC transporter substrate-binding protein [Micromonospora sp. NBC_01796]|uniref:ABC transporter substrate-binding protein n=1 Tax=Micromonospora sp. NBC_01796 TaxID=2975987 RepID=UPI002DDC8CB6|nr:ABC transporter substrate-binding protein [Micromonospora sp. NBC_01796]WSA85008.1 ABC transporter substrate-binding protein [Micromonospora sp. NBC_01796]